MSLIGNARVRETYPVLMLGDGLDYAFSRFDNVFDDLISGFNNTIGASELVISGLAPINGLDITFPPDIGTLVSIISTSTNDTFGGTGANILLISGLDSDFNPITDIIIMNGTTAVESTVSFARINVSFVAIAGSLKTNDGNIFISETGESYNGSFEPTTTLFNTTEANISFSLTSVYTVRANHTLRILKLQISTDASITKPLRLNLFQLQNNVNFRIASFLISTGISLFTAEGITIVPAKADLKFTAVRTSGSGALTISVFFTVALIDELNRQLITYLA